jgi:hypothetical protein
MSQTPEITHGKRKAMVSFTKGLLMTCLCGVRASYIARVQIVYLNTCSTSTTGSDMLAHPIQNHLGPLDTSTSKNISF